MTAHPHTNGALNALEREDRLRVESKRRNERFSKAVERARAAGFSERQAPFAAMAWLTLSALAGPAPTAAGVRKRVRTQYPFLFGEGEQA